MDKPPSRAERTVFWIGSICGIVTSLITVVDRVLTPGPPKLAVTFFESGTTSLSITPSVDTASETTEEIPLQLKIENTGGQGSENTKLYLTRSEFLELAVANPKDDKPTWTIPNQPLQQLSLAIENLNPGESYQLPIKVKFRIGQEYQRALAQARPDKAVDPLGFDLIADLSSDSAPNVRTNLQFLLGRCEVLLDRGPDVFWVGHNEERGVALLKVKEDYPCRE
jgi:hypothetical protein